MHKRHRFFQKEGSYICFPGDLWPVWLNREREREKLKSLYKYKISSSEQQNIGEKIDFNCLTELANKYATTTLGLQMVQGGWPRAPLCNTNPDLVSFFFWLLKYIYREIGFRMIDYCKEAQENKCQTNPTPTKLKYNRVCCEKGPCPFNVFSEVHFHINPPTAAAHSPPPTPNLPP